MNRATTNGERDYCVARSPNVFYVTPHYQDYTSVLARVWLLKDADLRELLESGYEFVVVPGKAKKRKRA